MAAQPSAPPAGDSDDATEAFWQGGATGTLFIAHCAVCQHLTHPPRSACPQCGHPLAPTPVSGAGVVFTHTVNHQQFHPDAVPPYVIALIELVEQPGLRLPANVVDCEPDEVYTGMPVHVQFQQRGTRFVPAFAPTRGPRVGSEEP